MLKCYVLAAAGLLVSASAVRADFHYAFDQADYQLTAGTPLLVPVYLEETADTEAGGVLAAEHGLAAINVLLQKLTADTAVAITAVMPNPLFDPLATAVEPAGSSFAVDVASFYATTPDPLLTDPPPISGLPAVQVAPLTPIWRVLLGWFELTASGATPQPVTFQAALRGDSSDAATFDAFYGPSPTYAILQNATGPAILAADVTITALAVPEPATGALLVVGAAVGLLRRRR